MELIIEEDVELSIFTVSIKSSNFLYGEGPTVEKAIDDLITTLIEVINFKLEPAEQEIIKEIKNMTESDLKEYLMVKVKETVPSE